MRLRGRSHISEGKLFEYYLPRSLGDRARTCIAWSAVVIGALVIAACGGGGGGGGGSCGAVTVYDSYGYNTGQIYGEIGEPVSTTLAAHVQSGCGVGQKLEGTLPPGMSFDANTGNISGTPSAGGVYAVTVHPDVPDWQEVRAVLTLEIQPTGRPTTSVAPSVLAPVPLPDVHLYSSIAVAAHGASTQLWIGGVRFLAGQYVLYTTVDEGAHWVSDDAGGLIRPRGDTHGTYKLTAYDSVAYVLDTGGSLNGAPMPSVLYRFDGSSWSVRNETLPFRAPDGAAIVATATSLAVAWSDMNGISLWTSADGGLNWAKSPATGGFTPDFMDHGELKVCLGQAGDDWHVTSVRSSSSWTHATLPAGSTSWTTAAWPWGQYAQPFNICASDGERFWIAGTGASTAENFLKLSDAVAGELSPAFPRRVPEIGPTDSGTIFDSMGAASGHVYGLVAPPNGHNTYVIWKLR